MILTYLCKDLRFAAWRRKQILKLKNIENMRKIFTTFLLCAAVAVQAQQLPNGGFDSWKSACGSTEAFGTGSGSSPKTGEMRQRPGVEPTDWNGSSINQKVVLQKKQELISNEGGAVVMKNVYVGAMGIGSVAPGFINLGTPWVYASAILNDCDGGVYGGVEFKHKPDAIKGKYKRSDSTGENSHIIVYLWNGEYESNVGNKNSADQKRSNVDRAILGKTTPISSGTLIASCDHVFNTTNGDWLEIVVPLEYVASDDKVPTMMNTIISGGDYWDRGNMKENTTLYADDVQFVYYSRLASLSYNGVQWNDVAADATWDLSDQQYDEAALNYAVKGQSAEGVHLYDEENALLTIAVWNVDADVDGNSSHTYYVQFAKSQAPDAPQPEVVEYTNDLMVSINGLAIAPQSTTIQLIKELDGTTSFALNNFVLADLAAIGNIKLTNVTVNEDGTITAEQSIVIEEGNDPAYNGQWIGHLLGEVPVKLNAKIVDGQLVADIDIDMTETLGEVIKVTFAPTVVYEDGSALQIIPGLKNVVLNRSFKAGWRTLCLPFDFNPLAFGEEAVAAIQEFTGADANTLYFSEVAIDGVMKANVPYLVNFAYDVDAPVYFGADVQENAPIAVEFGDWRFVGTYEGIAAPGMNGLYGVTEVIEDGESYQAIRRGNSEASINATRAYFVNVSGTYMQKSMRIDLDGNTTAIGCIKENEAVETVFPADVYSLDGRLVRVAAENLDGLAKGVYVVNGRKVVVK